MDSKYDTYTKDNVTVSYLLYNLLFELGLNPSSKGTIYLKELITYVVSNNLYDYSYNDILKQFIQYNHYENKNIKSNIKNALYRINTNKAKSNFKTYLNLQFDTYYLSPCNFINIIALKYNNFLNY